MQKNVSTCNNTKIVTGVNSYNLRKARLQITTITAIIRDYNFWCSIPKVKIKSLMTSFYWIQNHYECSNYQKTCEYCILNK